MDSSARPGLAVSGLMQQLKNGTISKMELFQQIAKLQAEKEATAPAVVQPSDPFRNTADRFLSTAAVLPVQASVLPSAHSASSLFHHAPPSAPASKTGTSPTMILPHQPQSVVPPFGATIVQHDADILASGVSHDKAPRFSVQEWIATKTRNSISSQVSQAFRQHYHQVPALEPVILPTPMQYAPPQEQFNDAIAGNSSSSNSSVSSYNGQHIDHHQHHQSLHTGAPLESPSDQSADFATAEEHSLYVYAPQRHQQEFYRGETATDADQGYIDFEEHYCGDDSGTTTGNGKGGNGGGNGGTTGQDDAAFHTRVTRWKAQKDAVREQMKQQLLQSELDECTFTPKVNPKSTKVAAKRRGQQTTGATIEPNTPQAVSERLYQEADTYKAREELAAKLKAEEEADLERECTFKPKINRSNSATDRVKAKYRDVSSHPPQSLTAAAIEATAKELGECTFQPKVNPISAEMVSAQLYLQQDIYERLSRPSCMASDSPRSSRQRSGRARSSTADDDDDGENTDDTLSPAKACSPRSRRCQDDMYLRSTRRRRRARARAGKSASPRRLQRSLSAEGAGSSEDVGSVAKEDEFESFIERQKFHEQARRKKIEATKQQLQPGHKPTINKKSLAMMENGRKGDFLERITKYALRKEHDHVKKNTVRASDPNCTFKPTINQTSTKRKGRSVTELSRGDLLRRETTQRLMKLKMEQEEMAALTFRPQLNRVSERHEGKLKIRSSPDTYLQRIQQHTQAHTIKQRRYVQEKEMEEFAECTFKPRTIEAPAYVQRIARSMSMTKAIKQQQQAASKSSEKPEWK